MSEYKCSQLVLIEEKTKKRINNIFCRANTDFKELYLNRRNCLHPEELLKFEEIVYPARQKSYLLGRHSAKLALIKLYSNLLPSDIFIENGVFEFPYIEQPKSVDTHVSISHSGDIAVALAYAQSHPMAIDIEEISTDRNDVIMSQASEKEITLASAISPKIETGLTTLWTAKEALSKVLKCGLLIDFKFLEVSGISTQDSKQLITFHNFPQYKAVSFQIDDSICTIVFPASTEIVFE